MSKPLSIAATVPVLFGTTPIRSAWHNNEWWFAVPDVVQALTDSTNITDHIMKMRSRDSALAEGWGQIVTPLSIETEGGKQKVNCANTQGILRIIQSVPSPKAEPFKQWLAKVGYERIKEIENPELATQRTRELYKAKGYPDEWGKRGVKGTKEYAILTAEISQATFGMKPLPYKNFKGIGKQHNLRDHMNDLELIFTMLGEAATTEIAQTKDAQGFGKKPPGGYRGRQSRQQRELPAGNEEAAVR